MWYWVIVPIAFYLYLLITAGMEKLSINELLITNPGLTVATLIASLLLIQFALLVYVQNISSSKNGLLGKYLWFAIIQQILIGNIFGAGMAFFYERGLNSFSETNSTNEKLITILSCLFIGAISLLVLLISIRMNK